MTSGSFDKDWSQQYQDIKLGHFSECAEYSDYVATKVSNVEPAGKGKEHGCSTL